MANKSFTITKRIAKHGNQSVIVVPNVLKDQIKPQTLVKVTIDVIEEDIKFNEGELK